MNRKARFFYGYTIVLAGFLVMAIMWGTFYSFGIFFEPVLTEFGWSRAATSGAFSLALVVAGLSAILMGKLNDHWGPRNVIMLCGSLLGLGFILMSRINAIWQLYVFYGLIVGTASGGAFVPVASTISRWFVRRRSLMTGFAAAGIGVGTFFMPPVASWLIVSYSWRTAYVAIGIAVLVLLLLVGQLLRRDPASMGFKPYGEEMALKNFANQHFSDFSLRRAVATRHYWLFTGALFCSWFSIGIIITHLVIHATDLNISSSGAATALALLGAGGILGRIGLGAAADRIGNRTAMIVSFIIITLSLVWLLASWEAWTLYIFALVFGFSYGGVSVLESPAIADLFGLGSHGLIFGVIFFSDSLGAALGAVLAGRVYDVTGGYQPAFIACVLLSLVSIALFLFLKSVKVQEYVG